MDTKSVAPRAPKTTTLDLIAEELEEQIARLRRLRPALDSRIDKATHILVTHLACPRSRTVTARVGADGRTRFLVKGSKGATYVVETDSWSCTCPDFHRSGLSICKHGLSCYLLVKAQPGKRTRAKDKPCTGCGRSFRSQEMVEVTEDHENLTFFPSDRLCLAECAGAHGVA